MFWLLVDAAARVVKWRDYRITIHPRRAADLYWWRSNSRKEWLLDWFRPAD